MACVLPTRKISRRNHLSRTKSQTVRWKQLDAISAILKRDYLCTVDYYSSYFEINQLKDKTGNEVIRTLKRHFSTHGIPNKLQSDHGPPYNSREFQQFMTNYDIEDVTSYPHHPKSNGKVENAITTAGNLLKNSKTAGTDFYLALLAWRNTPSEGLESSPAQRMFGRRTRTLIPTTSELLKPKIVEDVQRKLLRRKRLQAKHYNISAKELPPLAKEKLCVSSLQIGLVDGSKRLSCSK